MRRLRPRLLLSGLVIVLLIGGLLAIVLWERQQLSADAEQLFRLGIASKQARELSLYVQYNAHDTNAYTLGHLEHRQEFDEHRAAFDAVVAQLQGAFAEGVIEDDEQEQLAQIQQTRVAYDQASARLFAAADAHRAAPSLLTQREQDAAWEQADGLGDQLDEESQELAQRIGADVQRLQGELVVHDRQYQPLLLGLGGTIIVLTAGIAALSSRALGAPLQRLVERVDAISAGNYAIAVPTTMRRDEIGVLARATEQLASTLQAQVGALRQREEQLQTRNQELELLLETVRALEMPAIPLWENVLVVPLVGHLDTRRAETLTCSILAAVHGQRTQTVIIDITGVALIDTAVAKRLEQMVQSVQLLGARVLLTGMRAELAGTIATQGINLTHIPTMARLQDGVAMVLRVADRPFSVARN